MDYSLKATLYLWGVAFSPCKDCPYKGERPAISILIKTKKCFKRCPYPIMIWILSKEQLELYEIIRPLELKQKDIDKAQKEAQIIDIRIIQIKEIQLRIIHEGGKKIVQIERNL